jgi:hypothetical protein
MGNVGRPNESEFAPQYGGYVGRVAGDDVVDVLVEQMATVRAVLGRLSEAQAGYRYAEGKWSIREVLGHVIDAERVFGYRALAFARGERAPLPSYEENDYARASGHDAIPLPALVEEFVSLRVSHVAMFRHLPAEAWARSGTASGNPVTVRAIAFIIAGHLAHHMALLHERYGVPNPS